MHIGKIFAWLFRAILIILAFDLILSQEFIAAMIYIFIAVLSLLPIMLDEIYSTELHWVYDLLWSFMLAIHMLGFGGFYYFVPVWDDLGHIVGSAIIGFFGFSIFYALNKDHRLRLTLPQVAFLSVLLTVTVGALWEILEFVWDNIVLFSFSYGFAQNSLFDTMIDLVFDFTSAIMIAMILVFLIRKYTARFEKVLKPIEKIFRPRLP